MTDIQGLRAQLRDSRASAPSVSSGGSGVPFWAIAVVAAAIGFGIVLFAPRFFTTQRTAALPDFREAGSRSQPAESSQAALPERPAPAQLAPAQPVQPAPSPVKPQPAAAPPASPAPAPASRYAGKTPEEVVRLSDSVCEHRSQAVRNGVQPPRPPARNAQDRPGTEDGGRDHKVTAADEKLYCFLTEVPARFCAPNQKRKVTADVINYFKGIEYTNTAAAVAAKVAAMKSDGSRSPNGEAMLNKAEIDPRVVEALEGVIRAGYLTKANREEIGANVPREFKDRLARIIGSTPNCPKPPWWASFL